MVSSVDCPTLSHQKFKKRFRKSPKGEGNEDFAAKSFCKKKKWCVKNFFTWGL